MIGIGSVLPWREKFSVEERHAMEDCLDAAYAWKHEGLPFSEAIKIGVVYDQDGKETSAAQTQCRVMVGMALRGTEKARRAAMTDMMDFAVSQQDGIVRTNRGAFHWDELRSTGTVVKNERPPFRPWGVD